MKCEGVDVTRVVDNMEEDLEVPCKGARCDGIANARSAKECE